MPVTGIIPLTIAQAAIEATPGTIIPATRKEPILDGFLSETGQRQKVVEQRGSWIRNYRSHQIERHVEISGLTVQATYEDIAWFFQFFLKGGVTATTVQTTGKQYQFQPNATANDLKTATWELGDDTANFTIPWCVGNRMELGFTGDGAMTMSTDWLGQRAVLQARTGALTDRVTEDIIGSQGQIFIDTTTIGTTAVVYPLGFRYTIENHYELLHTLSGQIYPKELYRSEQRMVACEFVGAFDTTAEYLKFQPGTAGQRKIRGQWTGSTIGAGPAVNTLTLDWYGFWDESQFGEQNGLRTVTFRGESHYDTTATFDWQATVINNQATLP